MKERSVFLDMRICKNWAHKISSWKYLTLLWRPVLPVFPLSTECFIAALYPETPFRGFWKSAAVAAHDLILVEVGEVKLLVAQSCLTLCNPMDCSPPGSYVQGILQARILEWVAIPFSRESFWPRDRTQVSCIAGRYFTIWVTRDTFCLKS